MNNILYFVTGILVGSIVTYFVMQHLWNERLDRELESTAKFYERKVMEISNDDAIREGGEEPPVVSNTEPKAMVENAEEVDEYTEKIKNFGYGFVPGKDNDRDVHFAEREFPKDDEVVYQIDAEDFFTDCADYDKISLQYYTEDHVFVDDQCEPIDDLMRTIGIVDWPEKDMEEDLIYIRNDSLGADFEISKVYASYGEDVLGLGKEDLL